LSEIIAQQFRYRLLFEPEHEFQTKNGHLICDKFITESNITETQDKYLRQIFSNRVDSDWIAQLSHRKFKRHLWPFLPKKYIIKFVRGNLSAAFFNRHFDIPVLFIVRNPFDVIFSQYRVKFPWLYNLEHFKNQDALNTILDQNYNFTWSELDKYTDVQILALRWCIENKVVFDINTKSSSSFKILKYEELKTDINMFLSLCEEFNIKLLKNIHSIYNNPSSKTHPKSNIRGNNNADYNLTSSKVKEINVVLNKFKITMYPLQ